MKRASMLALAIVIATAACVSAAPYRVRWSQEDCEEVARWELWGSRGGQPMQLVATIPAASTLCATPTDIAVVVEATLRRGQWSFRLRAVTADNETADSDSLAVTIPLPRPRLLDLRRP